MSFKFFYKSYFEIDWGPCFVICDGNLLASVFTSLSWRKQAGIIQTVSAAEGNLVHMSTLLLILKSWPSPKFEVFIILFNLLIHFAMALCRYIWDSASEWPSLRLPNSLHLLFSLSHITGHNTLKLEAITTLFILTSRGHWEFRRDPGSVFTNKDSTLTPPPSMQKTLVLWGPVLRLVEDRLKTRPGLEKTGLAVLVFPIWKEKDGKRPRF